jgi:hypothetical protein
MQGQALVALAAMALLSGCGASSQSNRPSATPTPRDCGRVAFPYPTGDATLTAADSGKVVHVPLGGLVEVDLLGSPSRLWSPITMTGSSVVSLSTQAMTATVGTRLGEYCAVQKGNTTLSATDGTEQWSTAIAVP